MEKQNKGIFSPIIIFLVIANLIFLNLWTNRVFGRIDLTENQIYTLSDVTKEILRELEEPLTIKAFFTKDLPSPYNNIARYVEDQLDEMKAYGRGSFRYEFLDPENEDELKEEAQNFRLEPMQVNEVKADKVQYKLAYMGMVLLYEDKQEVIPMIQPQELENLEYEILSKIKRITVDETPTIGFLEGHDEPALRESMTQLDQELRKSYEIKPVNLSSRSDVPDDVDLLCIIGPKKDIPEDERFIIDQYLMTGGKLLMALNKVDADISQMRANRSALRIDPWTEHYGFKLSDELVMDRNAPTLPFQTMTRYGRQITMVSYPLFPEIMTFNRDNIAMKALRQVRFYFPTSVDTTMAVEMDSVHASALLYSSDKSSVQNPPYDINPLTQRGAYEWDRKNIPLGAVIQGTFESYWKGKDVPTREGAEGEEGEPVTETEIIESSPETRIVVLADANFIQDQFIVPQLDNLTMMLNLIDWMVQDERLISIRSREVSSRPIGDISDGVRRTVKYSNMVIPPLLVVIFGLFRWRMRVARRKRMELTPQSGSASVGGKE